MRTHLLALMLSASMAGATGLQAQTVSAEELDDVREIVDAKNGTIKRWEFTPRLVVIHDTPVSDLAVQRAVDVITGATPLTIAPANFIPLGAATDAFYRDSRFDITQSEDGVLTNSLLLPDIPEAIDAEIYLFVVSAPRAAHLMVLTSIGHRNFSLQRQYLDGTGPCFYNTVSTNDGMVNGVIFIDPTLGPEMIESCIYEELVQTMGLVNDAQDSPWFTFDNLPGDKPRDFDAQLLRALYDPSLFTGSTVEEVAAIYEILSSQLAVTLSE